MSDAPGYVYAGNRSTVLKRMLDLGLNVKHVLPVSGTWLEREAPSFGLPFTAISSKAQAFDVLQKLDFNVFVSTGFPFILPVSTLCQQLPDAKFVNIHPAFLPDLRGADPIPGAILFRRDSGVTCHLMDDGIDTGPIIFQQVIRYFDGLDSKLLYSLCFKLEPDVFEAAMKADFLPEKNRPVVISDAIYYSFKATDNYFNQADTDHDLVARIRAFNTPRKGFNFTVEGTHYRAFSGEILTEMSVLQMFHSAQHNEIVAVVEDAILVKREHSLIRISNIEPAPSLNMIGCRLTS